MVWDGEFKLIRRFDPEGPALGREDAPDLLFDTVADPYEERDIAARDPRRAARLREAAI
ncbi:MAG: hypothetical protein IPM24_00090 [Bryobacterales bacterium]|nr:hypothetical protein [Bryobacterales bacterium]